MAFDARRSDREPVRLIGAADVENPDVRDPGAGRSLVHRSRAPRTERERLIPSPRIRTFDGIRTRGDVDARLLHDATTAAAARAEEKEEENENERFHKVWSAAARAAA